MRWQGGRESENVEDRRGEGGGFGGGGMGGLGGGGLRLPIGAGGGGIGTIVVVLLVCWFLGINPLTLLSGMQDTGSGQGQIQSSRPPSGAGEDDMTKFVRVVMADTEDTWTGIFKAEGKTYRDPTLVLFSGGTQSGCGFAQAAVGPFYCPNDQKVYVDLAFYQELRDRFHAGGDFAQAYVIAHEVGHHVQNLLGILPRVDDMRQQMGGGTGANGLSVDLELQADCLAGVWGHDAQKRNLLEQGDLQEAMNAASQIGDDTIQRRSQGRVVPDSFTHGTGEQRQHWLQTGLQSGDIRSCTTFDGKLAPG